MKFLRALSICAVIGFILVFHAGCASRVEPLPGTFPMASSTVFGKVRVSVSGPSNRWGIPKIEFAEILNRKTRERIRLEFKSRQSLFVIPLPEGQYELTRIQIAEGGFRSQAQLSLSFRVARVGLNYLGTWEVSVAPPYYDRKVRVTVASELTETLNELQAQYPGHTWPKLRTGLLFPSTQEIRLFEVMPYPRVKYFRRHPAT